MDDFSSMSDEEKKGYLKALGIDPREVKSALIEDGGDDDSVSISIDRNEFSDEELSLLQRGSARIQGALNTTFTTVLKSSLTGLEVDEEVTVKINSCMGSKHLDQLSVREAIETGLEPFL